MPRGKKNVVIPTATPSTENVIISSESSSGKVKIDTLLWNLRELCRKHNLQMFNKESLANQIYQDLLFIYHIPKLMKDGILTLDVQRVGDTKLNEISYTSLLSLKEPDLISSSFKRLWKELQKCEIKDLFYGRDFTMFAIEKKHPDRYLALLVDLFKYISSITLEEYDSNAGYTYFKKDLNKAIAKTFGQFYTPNTVTSSVVKQVDPKVGEKILDPSCGSCSFLAETANYISKTYAVDMKTAIKNLYGIEVESNIYAEGVMNMFINFGILPDMTNNIREKDALIDLVSNNDEFDKVVANPPFGANASTFKEFYYRTTMEPPKGKGKKLVKKTVVNPDVKVTIPFPNVSESAILFFQLIVQKLKKNGVAGVVMSATILNDGFKDMMKWFLETCSLDKVVINPAGTFKEQGTSIETFSFIYKKGKPTTKVSVVILGAEDVVVREITIDQIKEAGWKLQLKEEEKKVEYTGGYDLVKLGDVSDLLSGKTNNDRGIGHIPFYDSNGQIGVVNTHLFDGEYVITARVLSVGSVNYVSGKFWAGDNTINIKSKDINKLSTRFFYYWLNFNSKILKNLSSGIKPYIRKSDVAEIKIPLPPLETQQQIVSTLDRIFADPQDMKDCLAFTDKAMDLMLKDPTGLLLQNVLGGIRLKRNHLKNATSIKTQMASVMKSVGMRGYERKKIGDVVSFTNGYAFKSEEFIDSGVPIVKITNIKNNVLTFNKAEYSKKNEKLNSYIVKNGDFVIALSGATLGVIGMNLTDKEWYLNQRVAKFNIISKEVLSNYIYYYTLYSDFIEKVIELGGGSAQPNVSTKNIETILIPIPPVETQQQILTILNEMEGERKSLEQMASKAEERAKFVLDGYLNSA